MSRIFENLFGEPVEFFNLPVPTVPTKAVKVDNEVLVSFGLAGVNKNNITISTENDILTVNATVPETDTEGEILFDSFKTGELSSSVRLTKDLDVVNATAKFKDGVLTVSIPVNEKAQNRTIAIA